MKIEHSRPDAAPWTRWDEVKQRLGNCRRMMMFAWLGLSTESATFAVVFINSARNLGDGLIAVTMRDGRRIDPDDLGNDARSKAP